MDGDPSCSLRKDQECCFHTYRFRVYLADSSHAAVNPLVPLAGLRRPLPEEQVDLVVVRAVGVGDGEGAHEVGL